jgi:hypothetical protein
LTLSLTEVTLAFPDPYPRLKLYNVPGAPVPPVRLDPEGLAVKDGEANKAGSLVTDDAESE